MTTRAFVTADFGNCMSCSSNHVKLHMCTSCNKVMCTKCTHGHTTEFCNAQREVGKQSEIHCRPDMVPLATLKVAEVCYEGNKKYDSDNPMLDTIGPISPNWHKITAREHINHALYHIHKCLSGDTSGEDHIAHATCRMMFALEMHLRDK